MQVISIANFKGGVGKTTTAINLAAGLQHHGYRVLLLDIDSQANLTQSLGITRNADPSIYTVIHKAAFGEETRLQDALVNASGLNLIPSSLDLANAEMELASVYGREQILAQLLDALPDYDYVLIDCPPAMSLLTINALVGSDHILIPLQAEYLPLKGALGFLKHYEKIKKLNKRLSLLGFVLTKYDYRKKMNRQIKEELEQEFGKEKIFQTFIRTNIALAKAQQDGQDIYSHSPRSNGALDYAALTEEFLAKVKS